MPSTPRRIVRELVYQRELQRFGLVPCYVCRGHVKRAEASLEHKLPRALGGTNDRRNLAISHRRCNSNRGHKLIAHRVDQGQTETTMRNISFAMTTEPVLEGTKTVTRRLGWLNVKPGEQLRPVRKSMGLRPGEKLDVLRDPITVVSVRREPLSAMTDDREYGHRECVLEGFGDHPDYSDPGAFVEMFCASHKGCTPDSVVTRIEFAY